MIAGLMVVGERAVTLLGAFAALAAGVALTAASGVVLEASGGSAGSAGTATALSQAGALLVMLAVIAAFVTTFIVASTFAFSVAQRRRELARLRLVGATPGQVSRTVAAEAMTVALASGLAGAVLTPAAVPALLWLLARLGAVPAGTHVPVTPGVVLVPDVIAAAAGLVVAVAGAFSAARRAGRVSPAEALRDAAVDREVMTRGRWIAGALAACAGCGMLALMPVVPADGRLPLAMFVSLPLVVAATMLGPVLVVPVTSLVSAAASGATRASGLIARRNLEAAVRRTASAAAPVLVMVGLTGSLLACTQVLGAATAADARLLYTSDLVATSAIAPADAKSIPGVAAAATISTTRVTVTAQRAARTLTALGVTPDATKVLGLTHIDGSLKHLHGHTITLARSTARRYHARIGGNLTVTLADHTRLRLRVVALYDGTPLSSPPLLPSGLVTAHGGHGSYARAASTHIRLAPGAGHATAARLASDGARVQPTTRWLARIARTRNDGARLGARALAAVALLYTFMAVANTTVITFTDRRREFARLRVTGASRAQILRMATWEALAVFATGTAFGVAVIAIAAGGLWQVLRGSGLHLAFAVPWLQLIAIAAACGAVVLLAALGSTGWLLAHRISRDMTAAE